MCIFKVHSHISTSFLFRTECCFIEWIDPILFTQSSADGPWGCLHFVATMNGVAMNIQVFVEPYVSIPLGPIPRSGMAVSHGNSVSNSLKNCPCPTVAAPVYLLANSVSRFQCHLLANTCNLSF